MDPGKEEKHYGGERPSGDGSLEKYLKNSKNSYLWASKEKKKMDLSLNEVFGRYWDRFYRHLKDLLVFSICYIFGIHLPPLVRFYHFLNFCF